MRTSYITLILSFLIFTMSSNNRFEIIIKLIATATVILSLINIRNNKEV